MECLRNVSHARKLVVVVTVASLVTIAYMAQTSNIDMVSAVRMVQMLSGDVFEPAIAKRMEDSSASALYQMFPDVAEEDAHFFKIALSTKHRNQLFDIMDKFHAAMTQENITYFISFGTLLGSYRHHDVVPWDDDIDVMVPNKQRVKFSMYFRRQMFSKEPTTIDFLDEISTTGKVFDRTLPAVNQGKFRKFSSPYVDIFFYDQDDTHLWHHPVHGRCPTDLIFPLTMRPFSGRMFPAPRDPHPYLTECLGFKMDDCYTGNFKHIEYWNLKKHEQKRILCRTLLRRHPFVRHVRGPAGAWCKEELMLRGRVTGTFVRSAEGIPVC